IKLFEPMMRRNLFAGLGYPRLKKQFYGVLERRSCCLCMEKTATEFVLHHVHKEPIAAFLIGVFHHEPMICPAVSLVIPGPARHDQFPEFCAISSHRALTINRSNTSPERRYTSRQRCSFCQGYPGADPRQVIQELSSLRR